MKKLVFLFLSLLTAGSLFQACDNSKTYAEMLEDEKNAVEKFIRDSAIQVISVEEFERNDTVTNLDRNEYVFFSSDGVYMQIVDRGHEDINTDETSEDNRTEAEKNEAAKFVDGNVICTRYLEIDMFTREIMAFNVPLEEYMNAGDIYSIPLVFRYVKKETYSAGTFIDMDYAWASLNQTTAVPQGWLLSLPYLRDNAHVRLIVPSKMGHQTSQRDVTPFYYDIKEFRKARS